MLPEEKPHANHVSSGETTSARSTDSELLGTVTINLPEFVAEVLTRTSNLDTNEVCSLPCPTNRTLVGAAEQSTQMAGESRSIRPSVLIVQGSHKWTAPSDDAISLSLAKKQMSDTGLLCSTYSPSACDIRSPEPELRMFHRRTVLSFPPLTKLFSLSRTRIDFT